MMLKMVLVFFFAINNKKYEGFWKDGKQHGKGVVTNSLQKKIYMEYFEGKKITSAIYDSIESVLYKEGCLIVKQNEKYGIINIKGTKIKDII